MAPRTRIWAYGSVVAAIIVAGLCRLIIGGFVADLVGLTVISLGFGAIVVLVFLEIGLSEDRERARDAELAAKRVTEPQKHPDPRRGRTRWRRRPD